MLKTLGVDLGKQTKTNGKVVEKVGGKVMKLRKTRRSCCVLGN